MSNVLIIGASLAGHTVAQKIREKDKEAQITLVSAEKYPFYDKRKLPGLLAGEIKEKDIFLADDDFYRQNNIAFLKEKEATAVNLQRRTAYFKDKNNLEYDFLVIACGVKPVLPDIPGARKPGSFLFYTLDDLKEFTKGIIVHPVCLVSSDEASLILARAITLRHKTEVKLISRAPFDIALIPQDVEVINIGLQEIIGEGEVQAIKLENGKAIGVCSVIFCDEFESNAGFLKSADIKTIDGFVLVDEGMQTSVEGVFACGSVCVRPDGQRQSKAWDEVINESVSVADNIIKRMGERCQTS
ncbi:MAG: FAD-dependent oxidoreductase [Candidatus Omnitrophota bacterium]|nr:FAD-dependent oxidoreductase [Candidatus Omnitrophota bacterium]MDD5655077.1 FAD-dependent oxidoreductase [Candidatus Omnitrophota bacterium]